MQLNDRADGQMLEALAELENASTRVYYDADNDEKDRQSYYYDLLGAVDLCF